MMRSEKSFLSLTFIAIALTIFSIESAEFLVVLFILWALVSIAINFVAFLTLTVLQAEFLQRLFHQFLSLRTDFLTTNFFQLPKAMFKKLSFFVPRKKLDSPLN